MSSLVTACRHHKLLITSHKPLLLPPSSRRPRTYHVLARLRLIGAAEGRRAAQQNIGQQSDRPDIGGRRHILLLDELGSCEWRVDGG